MSKEGSAFSNDLHKSTLARAYFLLRSSAEVFCKNGCVKKFRKFHWKTSVLESPFIKVAGVAGSATLLQKTPTQVFSCRICETFKNIYFVEHLQTTASGSCKHSIWTCLEIKDVDSTEFFRKIKLTSPHLKKRLAERLKVSVENSS